MFSYSIRPGVSPSKIGSVNLPKMGKISRGEILKMGRLRLKRKLYLWKKKIIQEGELGNWLRRNRSRSLGWIWATNLLGPREKLLLPPWSQVTDLLNYKWSKQAKSSTWRTKQMQKGSRQKPADKEDGFYFMFSNIIKIKKGTTTTIIVM